MKRKPHFGAKYLNLRALCGITILPVNIGRISMINAVSLRQNNEKRQSYRVDM
ncbi:TPA: hypothetical protein LSH87_001314 [Citrobacter koseri]|uniref:hypothetical protein n=1 Tax=Citrobacter koseri TaxID=545 RepID=UPI0023AF79AC|nr:hypothetical protein [Citrobacter koseri]HBL6923542.1 hypothetical protein [Citrobacter koseri]HBL6928369.1 hypothetical protein [Citrobacter koseri]